MPQNFSSVIKSKSTQERVMQMLLFLMEQKNLVARPTIERTLNVNARTIFRYLNIIEDEWKIPLVKSGGRYGVKRISSSNQNTFTSEEVQSLYQVLKDMPEGEMKQSIREKLLLIYQERKQAESLLEQRIIDKIEWLEHHVNQTKVKFLIKIKNYTSLNGDSVRTRILSPVYFNTINLELYAFDMEEEIPNRVLKVFKLDRMEGLEKLKERIPKNLEKDHDLSRDPFGFLIKGQGMYSVCMNMDLIAFKLFELQFPSLMSKIEVWTKQDKVRYRLQMEVVRPDPLVGFCLGQLNHIEFENSDNFLSALKGYFEQNIQVNLGKLGI